MKLEVGMYVRTFWGEIFKVIGVKKSKIKSNEYYLNKNIDRNEDRACNDNILYEDDLEDEISKARHDIIDLIEVGDYVNGYKVTKINIKAPITNNKAIECGINSYGSSITYVYDNKDIKSIVTKEQFSQMKYKVGE